MIHVIIPVHNRIELTLKCITSLKKQENSEKLNIFVIDDGSTDETSKILAKKFPNINLIKGTGSLFWCGAVNFGIDYVLKIAEENDWILLVNNDAELKPDALYHLIKSSKKRNRKAITGSLTLSSKDKQTVIKSGTIIKSWFFNITKHLYKDYKFSQLSNYESKEVDLITGRCLLHPIEVFKEVGNYDAITFNHYGGDDEFSMRAKRYGYSVLLCPLSVVFLEEDKNISQKKFNINNFLFLLFDIKSSSNIINKLKLTRKIVPFYAMPSFFLIGVIKSIYIFFIKK
tara:strand:- start:1434 stop:2291 length:858 start_codon:yes stop_codon:yes gene_type:complete